MMISRQSRFLFVHIQKTAGTSLINALQGQMPDLKSFLGTHDTALHARRTLGEAVYDGYSTAAFVRNPWDRLVSWYTMIDQRRDDAAPRLLRPRPRVPLLWQYVRENSASFEEFIRNCTAEIDDHDGRKSFCWNQVDYLEDGDGRRIVDFIGRYENLQADSDRLFERLGLPAVQLPRLNTTERIHYSAYFTDELTEIVRQRYQRDIAAFGYEFVRHAGASQPG
jgi:hypothetical protein